MDILAWSPDGSVYVMVTGDHIDVCAFEVCNINHVICDFVLKEFCYTFTKEAISLPWLVYLLIFHHQNVVDEFL